MEMDNGKKKLTIYLAPMQGLTDAFFRSVIHSCSFANGFDIAVSPFISITHGDLSAAHKKIKDVLEITDSLPVIPQIMGNEPKEFIDLANLLFDYGYTHVNWNLGCPIPKVAKKHHGSGLLHYPDEVNDILSKVVPNIKPCLSIKMRTGYSQTEYMPLIEIFNQFPLESITIHPRLGIQMYEGKIDYDAPRIITQTSVHKIIYNGDIYTYDDYLFVQNLYPNINNFMIGRGAIANPLVATEIKSSSKLPYDTAKAWYYEYVDKLLSKIETLNKPEQSKINKSKEYFRYIAQHLKLQPENVQNVLQCNNLHDVQCMIKEIVLKHF